MTATFVDDVIFPEAPVLLDGDALAFVEMGPGRGWVARVEPNGRGKRTLAVTGRPNGLALDRHGMLWVAETVQRAVLRLAPDGTVDVIAGGSGGSDRMRFLFLNDLTFGPRGDLFVTDSGVELEDLAPGGEPNPRFRELEYDGSLYRVDPASGDVERVDRGLQFLNGLAFGPDGNLYVAETLTGMIYRYPCRDGRIVSGREPFGNVIESFTAEEVKGPDGMKFGTDGRLYVCVFGQGDVTVLDSSGRVAERLPVDGAHPTNLCFGPPGSRRLYVTEVDTSSIQTLEVDCDGHTLHG